MVTTWSRVSAATQFHKLPHRKKKHAIQPSIKEYPKCWKPCTSDLTFVVVIRHTAKSKRPPIKTIHPPKKSKGCFLSLHPAINPIIPRLQITTDDIRQPRIMSKASFVDAGPHSPVLRLHCLKNATL